MLKAVIAAIVTFFISILAEANLAGMINCPGIGTIIGISVMGAFVIYFQEKKWYPEVSDLVSLKKRKTE